MNNPTDIIKYNNYDDAEERHNICYRSAFESLYDTVIEIDLDDDKILSTRTVARPYMDMIKDSASYSDAYMHFAANFVHSDDLHRFIDTFGKEARLEAYDAKAKPFEFQFRLKNVNKNIIWISSMLFSIPGKNGHHNMLMAFKDIHEKKIKEIETQAKSERDGLTRLYNKSTTHIMVDNAINNAYKGEMHALMLIDIDNFKYVNDNFGHLFGDAVLSEIAEKVRKNFRGTDIIGRVGGDEFIAFLRDIPNEKLLQDKATALCNSIRTYYGSGEQKRKVSASIGIAVFPTHSTTTTALYSAADSALYNAKDKGKDGWVIFSPDIKESVSQTVRDARKKLIEDKAGDRDRQKPLRNNIVEYIFKILNSSKELQKSIPMIFELVGKHFNVSRVYLFEAMDDRRSFASSIEWRNVGISSESNQRQNFTQEQYNNYFSCFDDSGLFHCCNVTSLSDDICAMLQTQGIKSVLQILLIDSNEIAGYIGFDECTEHREWSDAEIETLSLVASIVGVFVMKHRSRLAEGKMRKLIHTLLDRADSWMYAIDRNTHELIYANQKALEVIYGSDIGQPCYKVLRSKDLPCEDCPLKSCSIDGDTVAAEICGTKFAGMVEVSAVMVNWIDGNDVYFVYVSKAGSEK